MARARIQLNGIDARAAITAVGSVVTFSNDDEGGETTYLWSIVDQPEGTADNLASPASETTTLTVTKEGSYQIRLVVNLGSGTEAIQTATVSVLDSHTNERVPAATETIETGTQKGWAAATNRIFRRVLIAAVDGNLQHARTPGGISPGAIVKIAGVFKVNTGFQSEYETVGIAAALGTVTVPGRLGILIDGVSPGDVSGGALVIVRMFGLVPFVGTGAPLVGGSIYLGDSGLPSLSPGTVSRVIGTVMSQTGSTYRWTFDGVDRGVSSSGPAGVTLPTDCGDGSSGSFVLDGVATPTWASRSGSVYTLLDNVFLNLLTINVGVTLKTDGWSMRMKQAPINNGTIDCSGGDAVLITDGTAAVSGSRFLPVSNSSGTSSSSAPNVFPTSTGTTAAGASVGGGGSSGGSAPSTAPTAGRGGGSGAGGNSSPFTSQGAAGNPSPTVSSVGSNPAAGDIRMYARAAEGKSGANTVYTLGTWGAVGGAAATLGGGGRGAAGGYIFIACPGITGSGTISAKGGAGGNGSPGAVSGNAGSGGGGGGAGGIVILALQGFACTNTVNVSGGTAGTGGTGNGLGGNGGAGQPGGAGADIRL